jgi:hypothetical protein
MTLDHIDEILRTKGYPAREELQGFPIGRVLLLLDSCAWTSNGRMIELYEKENPNSRDLGVDEQDLTVQELEERLREQGRILSHEEISEVHRHHISHVIKAAVQLTTNSYYRILERRDVWSPEPFASYAKFLDSSNPLCPLGLQDSFFRKFLRLAALYHDVGKIIHRERHGVLGKHLLETLSDDETADLRAVLRCDGEDYFPLFIELIGHHDLFGMLCTGEASRPVLLDTLRLEDPVKILGCHATLNIADIYSTLKTKNLRMDLRIFQTVLEDWKFMVDLVKNELSREPILFQTSMEKQILFYSQQREYAAERIKRMLVSSIFMITEVRGMWGARADHRAIEDAVNRIAQKNDKSDEPVTAEELKWLAARVSRKATRTALESCIGLVEKKQPAAREIADAVVDIRRECYISQDELKLWARKITDDVVVDALRKRLGSRLVDFCDSFALVCKFNYTLRFVQMLVGAWINERIAFLRLHQQLIDPKKVFEYIDVRELPAILAEILARLVNNYQDLTVQKGQRQRRIGIELLGVTRSTAIANRIIELMLHDRTNEGINWIVDEATAWYFV